MLAFDWFVALFAAERARRGASPVEAVAAARMRGQRSIRRTCLERERLRRWISRIDRVVPNDNCYRRALMEIALDAGAAEEPLRLGFVHGGGPLSGHAWLGDRRGREQPYDAEITL